MTTVVQGTVEALEALAAGALELDQLALTTDYPQARAFYEAAADGTRGFAELLRLAADGDQGKVVEREDLIRAQAVARIAGLAGWISAGQAGFYGPEREALRELEEAGVIRFFDKVPGRYVACYRLMACRDWLPSEKS